MTGWLVALVVGMCWVGRCWTCPHRNRMARLKDDLAELQRDLGRLRDALRGSRDE